MSPDPVVTEVELVPEDRIAVFVGGRLVTVAFLRLTVCDGAAAVSLGVVAPKAVRIDRGEERERRKAPAVEAARLGTPRAGESRRGG